MVFGTCCRPSSVRLRRTSIPARNCKRGHSTLGNKYNVPELLHPASPRRQPCGPIPPHHQTVMSVRILQGKAPTSHIADGDMSLYKTANDTFPQRMCPAHVVAIACFVHRRTFDGESIRLNPHSSRCGLTGAEQIPASPRRQPCGYSSHIAHRELKCEYLQNRE